MNVYKLNIGCPKDAAEFANIYIDFNDTNSKQIVGIGTSNIDVYKFAFTELYILGLECNM